MKTKKPRYQLEFRMKDSADWITGSAFGNLQQAKACVDATLANVPDVTEGRVFDIKLSAFRYYRTEYPFKP